MRQGRSYRRGKEDLGVVKKGVKQNGCIIMGGKTKTDGQPRRGIDDRPFL